MRRSLAFIGCVSLVCSLALAATGQSTSMQTRYDIRVTLDSERHTLVGVQDITYVNETDESVDDISFVLLANLGAEPNPYLHPALSDAQYVAGFDPTWTKVSRVIDADGTPMTVRLSPTPLNIQTYSLEDGLLTVHLPAALAPGQEVDLRMTFETKFARSLAGDQCVYRDTYVWRFGWNPIAVGPDELAGKFELPAANYHVELTVPDDYRAFGGADTQQIINASSGLTTLEFSNTHPTRSIPLLIGRDLQSVQTDWNGVTLEAVYLPGAESYARAVLSYGQDILAYYTQRFGALPSQRILIAENPCPGFFGIAANGMVLIGSSAITMKDMPALGAYDRIDEYLLAHELAHQWWGIGIGADFDAENWISEGFAEFLSITYFEEQHGAFSPNLFNHLQPGLAEDVLSDAFGYLNLRQHMSELPYLTLLKLGFDEPLVEPLADSEFANGVTVRTYNKGYLVLRALQSLIGQEEMFALLKTAHEEWDGKLLSVQEFQRLAERVTHQDLNAFFAAWVTGDAQADVALSGFESKKTAEGYVTSLHITGVSSTLPVTLEAALSDGSTVREELPQACCEVPPTLTTNAPVVSVTLDPDEMIPDANRFNNHWPRRINFITPFGKNDDSENAMPLDAYVVKLSAAGISGHFRNDHAWSLSVVPHISVSDDWQDSFPTRGFPTVDVIGAFQASIGRSLGISFTGLMTDLDLSTGDAQIDASLSLLLRGFTHPSTGTVGQYWYPTWQQTLSIGSRGTTQQPVPYVSLSVLRDDRLSLYMTNSVTVQLGIPGFGIDGFGSASWQITKRFRLAPLVYLDATASIQESLYSDLPDEFLLSMTQLHAFDYLPMGHHQVYGHVQLVFPPLVRDSGYAIFNLTRLDSVIPSVFVQGGITRSNCAFACQPGTRLEAGAEVSLSFAGFLGTSLTLGIGYAHPLIGSDGAGRLFVDLGTAP